MSYSDDAICGGVSRNAGSPEPEYSSWILHPVIDVLFCCGGLLWILAALHFVLKLDQPLCLGSSMKYSALVVAVGAICFANPHTAATLVRLYGDSETRQRLSFVSYYAAAALFLLGVVAMFCPAVLTALAKAYLILIWHHVLAQAYGLVLIYCGKRGYVMKASEKRILKVFFHSVTLFVIARQLFYVEFSNNRLLGMALPSCAILPGWGMASAKWFLLLSSLVFAMMLVRKWLCDRRLFPFPAFMLMTSLLFAILCDRSLFAVFALYVPAFFHSSQYLVVTTACQLKEHRTLGREYSMPKLFSAASLSYWGAIMLMGIFFYAALPFLFSKAGVPFATATVAVFCAINLHHFLADAVIWKAKSSPASSSESSALPAG